MGAAFAAAASRFLPAGAQTGATAGYLAGTIAGGIAGAGIGLGIDALLLLLDLLKKKLLQFSAQIQKLEIALKGVTKNWGFFKMVWHLFSKTSLD